MAEEIQIPQPPTHFGSGNVPDVDLSQLMASGRKLYKLYGPIYRLDLAGSHFVHIASQQLMNEVCDDERFEKKVSGPLWQARHLTGTGLFTSDNEEHDWKLAHKLLMPVFGPLAIQKMFPQMLDITSQMLMKWQHFGEKELIDPVDAFTRLTLDTIALCAFDYRFNSFYRDGMHPFVTAALGALVESGKRAGRLPVENKVRIWSKQKYDEQIQFCWKLCDEIVADRRAHPRDVSDLLSVMLKASDPETGEMMSDELIRYEMMTFLIAGHDTTSGLLNFAFLLMLKNPKTLQAAQAEVDRVIGDGPVEPKHYQELKYIEAVLRETLRLYPTAPSFSRRSKDRKEDIFIGGDRYRYRIHPTDLLSIQLTSLHRDPTVWGEDADDFRPERMLDGGYESLPANSWKPVELAEHDYELKIRQTLTIKPLGWHMKARLRPGKSLYTGIAPHTGHNQPLASNVQATKPASAVSGLLPLALFYGSNQGTCKTFAESIQSSAPAHGFSATVGTLDSATENIPQGCPVVFIAPSYEGEPPDNGKRFVAWLEAHGTNKARLQGVKYCTFGVGNSDWIGTFHRIPKLIDNLASAMGGSRIMPMVLGNVNQDIFGAFDQFSDSLWKALGETAGSKASSTAEELKVDMTLDRPELLGEKDISLGTVSQTIRLADDAVGPEKKLIDDVNRVLNRFSMPLDAMLKLSGSRKTFLPHEHPEYAYSLIAAYLELGTPVSRKQLGSLAAATDGIQKAELERLSSGDAFEKEILAKRASIIDVLEHFPECKLSFAAYIDMLHPMHARQYSIASSPLASAPGMASILYDVLDAPSLFDPKHRFHGVGSTYLSNLPVGARVHCYVKPTNANFRLPLDHSVPIIMVCAGTGLAPMRGFIQERAAIAKAQKVPFGKALLYFGCRDPDKDFICRQELEEWEKLGVVQLRPAFSQAPSASGGFVHVPDRLSAEASEIIELFRGGAKVFLCGSASKLAKSTNEIFEKLVVQARGCSAEEAKEWLHRQKSDRYLTDIFG
ncbi:hypothetical protein LTR65_003881 [Meristemomyces frigidus]